jgi:RNase P/RNase MRP subunit p30
MKKAYADLHLCPNLRDPEQVSRIINKASKLGYRLLAIPFPPNCMIEEIEKIRNMCKEVDIDLASRVDLRPRSSEELIRNVRKLRRRFEMLAVLCDSKGVARQAAKDRRVDLLNFPSLDYRSRFFDIAEAELASSSLASFEIDVKPLLTLESPARTRLIANLRREAVAAQALHVPIVLSSGVSDELLIRKPMELAALASLFDLRKDLALEAVSKNPLTIVKRNREKLDTRFIAPGIRVVRRGKDC